MGEREQGRFRGSSKGARGSTEGAGGSTGGAKREHQGSPGAQHIGIAQGA